MFKATAPEWGDYFARRRRLHKAYFVCPQCGSDEGDVTNMKHSDVDNGQYYENWICGSCGARVTVTYAGEDDSSDVDDVSLDE